MKNCILIIIVIVTAILAAKSQDLLWQKRYIREVGRFYYPTINQIGEDILMVNLIRTSDTIKVGTGNTFLITRLIPDGDTLWNKRFVLINNVINNFDLLKYDNDTYMIYGIGNHIINFYYALFNNSGELIEENYLDKFYSLGVYVSDDFDFMISKKWVGSSSKFYK